MYQKELFGVEEKEKVTRHFSKLMWLVSIIEHTRTKLPLTQEVL